MRYHEEDLAGNLRFAVSGVDSHRLTCMEANYTALEQAS